MVESIKVEVCIISARGLSRSSPTLWKHHWFAVGWIDPNDKYCTTIDTSGNRNPDWKTKFTTVVDYPSSGDDKDDVAALCVEVYSRDPIFFKEKLQGTATIPLKEFLDKHGKGGTEGREEVGSFQLRKKNSSKPNGFVDISIRTLQGKDGAGYYTGYEEGFQLTDNNGGSSSITLNTGTGPVPVPVPVPVQQAYPQHQQGGLIPQIPFSHPGNAHQSQPNYPYTHPVPYPSNYTSPSMVGPNYPPAVGPSFPPSMPLYPLPSNVGHAPVNDASMYVNMPQTQASGGAGGGRRPGPGIAAGVGVGALAAGAVIMGDDLMSGFDFSSSGFQNPTFGLAINPPF